MSWLNFFDKKTTPLIHPFGRGINANISPHEEELFNKSDEAFEKKDILNAYEYFFKSLENFTNGVSNQNIFTTRDAEKLNFIIFQGSAKITGYITQESLYAEAIMCKITSPNVALKRHLLDRNYLLTYAYYFMDGDLVKLKLYHDNITMTPQKIFFPLREIALNADFDKEYIRSEFKDIELQEIQQLQKLPEGELKIKYDFLQKSSLHVLEKIKSLPSNDNAGMQAFLLLNTLYMLDYLLVAKYNIYQKSSKKIQEYFTEEGVSIETKNDDIKNYIIKLQSMNFEEFEKNFYTATYTFSPTEKTAKEDIDNFISESLVKIRWYKNNRYNQVIPTIYKYIAFYILYNYGLHPAIKELLHTLVQIQNEDFFGALEYKSLYCNETQIFSKKMIISQIENIIEPHVERFKLLEPFGEELNYSSLNEFSNSFYQQIQNLNFEEI
ncbi:hypothetical protein JHD48_07905 [Sulfurimonas sp. SAG-AH-194-I05]|nr:hypothetical protein [Sulfurimonas sp. SAG-AH-194-I05]MDF1875655.1 hypothetical protein [Sulfurimonas sp. SAG-AH-194-I05]